MIILLHIANEGKGREGKREEEEESEMGGREEGRKKPKWVHMHDMVFVYATASCEYVVSVHACMSSVETVMWSCTCAPARAVSV